MKIEKYLSSITNYIRSKVMNCDEVIHARMVAELTGYHLYNSKAYTIALLHDMVEDDYATFEELQQRFDLDAEQMAALDAITRRQGEQYFDYIKRVKQNEMAKTVKLADLQHNISRCANDLPNRWGLVRRYGKAYGMLIGEWKEKGK